MQKNLFYDTCLIISYEILIRKLLGVKVINMWSYNAMFKMAIYFVERNIDKLLLSCKKKLFPEYFAEYIRWIKQIINFWFTNYVKPILWNKDKLMYFTFFFFLRGFYFQWEMHFSFYYVSQWSKVYHTLYINISFSS